MKIEWIQKAENSVRDWHFGKTNSRFKVEVGPNTDKEFSWIIFHEDFKHAVYGDSAKTIDEAKQKAEAWLNSMTEFDRQK